MGRVKDKWIETQERGWSAPNSFVCAECVGDEYLAEVVESNLSKDCCSYCGRCEDELIATDVENIMPYVAETFYHYFADPSQAGLPRDSGEWVGEHLITDTEDAFLSLGWACDDGLFKDICNAFENDAWLPCSDGWWLGVHEHERRRHAWEGFVQLTKHKTRYFFSTFSAKDEINEEDYPPARILEIIGRDIEQFELLKELSAGTDLYRVRSVSGDVTLETFKELGPPPPHLAPAGRMNPPGISYGYFAYSSRTAVLEVADTPPCKLTIGGFRLRKPVLAVDLTSIPTLPSIFDVDNRSDRDALIFLKSFVEAIATPVAKDGRQHIDFVPSQIVSEYFSQRLRVRVNQPVGALL